MYVISKRKLSSGYCKQNRYMLWYVKCILNYLLTINNDDDINLNTTF